MSALLPPLYISLELSQKKRKSNTRARIRYRISNRFDLRNLNYATEETSERDDPELEENPRIEEINEEGEENISFVSERTAGSQLAEFGEISVQHYDVLENDLFTLAASQEFQEIGVRSRSQEPDRKVSSRLNRGIKIRINL